MKWLLRSSRRWLQRRPWQSGLALLGIALAVAVVTGVDLANESARRAFQASVDGVAGQATHEIVGGPRGLDESVYVDLRLRGLRTSAPVVEGWVEGASRPLMLMGVDPYAEGTLRSFTQDWSNPAAADGSTQGGATFDAFVLQAGAMVVGEDLAAELGLSVGDELVVQVAGTAHTLHLIATLDLDQDLQAQSARDLLLTDLTTAQEVLGKVGRLSRIDLRLDTSSAAAGEAAVDRWRQALPHSARLQSKASRSDVLDQMTSAFRLNLRALSLLAMLVGMFLIYNTMTFAVVERRPLLGSLRVLGVTRRQIFSLILGEALVIGLLASALGMLLGFVMARFLLALVTQTINDLYFVLSVGEVSLSGLAIAKGLLLGTLGTAVASLVPAIEAMGVPPRQVMQRSALEGSVRSRLPRLVLGGFVGLLLSAGLLAIPSSSLVLGFAILLLFILSCALLVSPAMWLAMTLLEPLARRLGLLTTMAVRGVTASSSRTGVATAALVVAVSMTLGVALMVSSFRATLADWLNTTLEADVYVAPVDFASRGHRQDLDPVVIDRLLTASGIDSVTSARRIEVPSRDGPTQLFALSMERRSFKRFQFLDGSHQELWPGFVDGGVLISEPFAHHRQLRPGDDLELLTDRGWQAFPILGVYYDYGSDRGVVSLLRPTYDAWWDDPNVHTLAIYAKDGVTSQHLIDELRRLADGHPLWMTANRELRQYSLDVFDRTFAITEILRLLALGVAFLGILSALMALQLERRRELAMLRAQGLTPKQLAVQVMTQTSLMGTVAGILSIPLGIALSVLLIEVINRRAFGWTLRLELSPSAMAATLVLAVVAALLAGCYPAWRLANTSPASGLREE